MRTGMSPEVRLKLAEAARFSVLYGMTQQEIARELGMSQSAVSRVLQQAREMNVIGEWVDPGSAVQGSENLVLQHRVRDAFGLNDVSAISLPGRGNDLHIALANAAGVKARDLIKDGDHIAVAGGRAIVRLAQVISRRPRLSRDVTVSPLSGRLWFGRPWKDLGRDSPDNLSEPLNADYSALLLALGLIAGREKTGIQFSQISQPLFAANKYQAGEIIAANCPFEPDRGWKWGLRPPTKAYVGVGVIEEGHRVIDYLRVQAEKAHPSDELAKRYQEIQEVVQENQDRNLPAFGSLGNRFFPTLPFPDELEGRDLRTLSGDYLELIRRLELLNDFTVVAGWSHLLEVESLNLIAGGLAKRHCVWTVLLASWLYPELKLVSELTIDAETATILLQKKQALDHSPAETRAWFKYVIGNFLQMASKPRS